jgi:hypothetical protein
LIATRANLVLMRPSLSVQSIPALFALAKQAPGKRRRHRAMRLFSTRGQNDSRRDAATRPSPSGIVIYPADPDLS